MKNILASGWLVVGFLACVGLSGCAQHQAPAMGQKGPPEVFVSLPVSKPITDYEEFSGRLESNASIQIRARVTGYLLENPDTDYTKHTIRHYFKEGGLVKKGDLLFKIDPQLYEAALASAQGNLLKAQGQFEQAKADWIRVQKLRVGDQISEEELNKFRGAYFIADGELKAARANLKTAQVNMDYTRVVAPISGRITKAAIDPGNLVKADDTILTSIGAVDPVKAYFDVDERTVARVLRLMEEGIVPEDPTGTPVEMGLADEEGRPHKGAIDFFDTYVDSSTGTLRVRGAFDNPDGHLVPGMFVRVRLPIGKPQEAILIAEKALVTDQGQKFVYVVTNEKQVEHDGKMEYQGEVKYRRVKLGRLHGGLRVVKEGLAPNEKVVVSGLQRVRPDITVKFEDKDMMELVSAANGDSLDPSKIKPAGGHSAGPSRAQPSAVKPTSPKKDKGEAIRMKGHR